jgi:hypothetical protein
MPDMTSNRLAVLRAACFAYFAQRDRASAVRGVPIEYRGRRASNVLDVERANTGSGDTWRELSPRTLSDRASDIARSAAVGPVIDVERVERQRRARQVLVSPSRFAAWYLPRFYAATLPRPNVATDYAAAVADARLVDVERVRHGVYLVSPRDAIPTWEYDGLKTPHVTPSVKPYLGTPIKPYGRLTANEYTVGARGYVPRSMVPLGVMLASAADPMAYSPRASRLQREARLFLGEHGENMPLPDVFDTKKMRWHSRPDRVAHRGTVRVRRNAPMRYEHGYRVETVDGVRTMVPALDKVHLGADGQYALATVLARRYYCQCGPLHVTTSHVLDAPAVVTLGYQRNAAKCKCEPRGWRGHVATTFPRSVRAQRAADVETRKARPRRAANVNAGPWSIGAANLARATRAIAADVADVERVLRAAADGESVTFADGTRVRIVGAASVWDVTRERAYPIREWARRTALAAVTPTAAS